VQSQNTLLAETIACVTGFFSSIYLYNDVILKHAINSGFVIFNTVLAFWITHKLKKFFEKKGGKDENSVT